MRIDFIGVGFGRTGSNWLCNCLFEHPEISIPKFNLHTEINYFPEEYEIMGLGNYLKKFKKCDFSKVVGEISTMIIMKKRSAKLLKKLFPNTKIIIYRRSEEGRATSVFNIQKNHDLFDVEKGYINQEEYIEPWIKEFGQKQVHIFDMENLNKQQEFNKLCKFLKIKKISPSMINQRTNSSYSKKGKNKPLECKYPLTRKIINKIKAILQKNKRCYYFLKRNCHFDYYYQLVNHGMSS
ncbi:sulfotransferase domain-containing protein [Candidatus Pacearchaeota archaeon]|nr:sulfotransferase domain-containing protein [Candidatus Pacearchaeota archaeon]